MKKISITALLFVFVTIAFAQTSEYYPFPTQNAYWSEVSDGYQCYCCAKYQHILAGDTLINGITYQKIIRSGRNYGATIQGDCNFYSMSAFFSYYKGAIRDDVAGKKIWFVPADSSSEELLYDFNLKLHDTLELSYINHANLYGGYNIVETVDSVSVNGVYHNSYGITLTNNVMHNYVYLIEGVGSTQGLFGSMGNLAPGFESGSGLSCLSVNGTTIFPESAQNCQLITQVNNAMSLISFSIFPNPVTETAVLIIPDQVQQVDIQLCDASGRIVFTQEGVKNGFVFSRRSLSNGMYFYKFIKNTNVLSYGKLIIN